MTNFLLCIFAVLTFFVAQLIYIFSHMGFFPASSYMSWGTEWDFTVYLLIASVTFVLLLVLLRRLWVYYKNPNNELRPQPKTPFGMMLQTQEDDYDDLFDDLVNMLAANNRQSPIPGRASDEENKGSSTSFTKLADLIPTAVSTTEEAVSEQEEKAENVPANQPTIPEPPKEPAESPVVHAPADLKPSIRINQPVAKAPEAAAPPTPILSTNTKTSIPAPKKAETPAIKPSLPIARPASSPAMVSHISDQPTLSIPVVPATPETPAAPVVSVKPVDSAPIPVAPNSEDIKKPTDEPVIPATLPKAPPKEYSLSPSEMRKTMMGKNSPLEATVAVFEKAGIPSSLYAIDCDRENAICVHHGRNGMFEIYDFVDGSAKNVYIAKDELTASRTLTIRVRERLA